MFHFICGLKFGRSYKVIFLLFIIFSLTVFGVESLSNCPYPDISIESRSNIKMMVCINPSMQDCYTINYTREKTFPQDTKVTYACVDNKSYELVGSERRICQASKTWSGTAPKCRLRETTMFDDGDANTSFRSIQGRSYSPSPDDNNDQNYGSSSGANSNAIVIGIVVLLFIIAIALGIISCIYIRKMRKLDRAMSDNRSGNLFTVREHPVSPIARTTTRPTGPRYATNPNEEWRDNERAYQNIIPLRVNNEPQYIQVETSSGPMFKVPYRQSSENVVYSEIIHQNPRT